MTSNEASIHDEPVAVASYSTRGEAEIVEAKLRAFGIESAIEDVIEGGAMPVEGESGVAILVHPNDADEARRLLSEEPSAS